MSVTARFKVVIGALVKGEEAEEFMRSLTDEQCDFIIDSEFFHCVTPMGSYDFILGVSIYNQEDEGYAELKSSSLEEEDLCDLLEPLGPYVKKLEDCDEDLYEKLKVLFTDRATLLHTYIECS